MKKFIVLFAVFVLNFSAPAFAANEADYQHPLSEGVAALEKNKLHAASRYFEVALKANANGLEAHYYAGVALARRNKDQAAEGHFLKALEIDRTFFPARLDLGVLYFKTRQDEKALLAFKIVEKLDPKRAKVHYYQGVILKRNGKDAEGEAKIKAAVVLDPTLAVSLHFQAATVHYQKGAFDAAKREFQQVLRLSPNGELSETSRGFINRIETLSKGRKRLHLSASFGLQYDDNVVLEPSNAAGGSVPGIDSKDDLLGIVYLQAQYRWFERNQWHSDVKYSLYQNIHNDSSLNDFNIQDHQLNLSVGRRLGVNALDFIYNLQFTTLGDDPFLLSHQIGPVFTLRHNKTRFTELFYRYGMKDFDNIGTRFSRNADRDVDMHQAGGRYTALFGDKGNAYVGYSYQMEEAGDSVREDDWSFKGHALNLGVVAATRFDMTASLELTARLRNYDNVNEVPSPKVAREDEEFLVIAVLSKPITKHTQLSAQYLYQKSDSNIAQYEYERNIIGLIVTASY